MGYGGFEMGFFWYAGYEFQKVGEKSGMRDWAPPPPSFTPIFGHRYFYINLNLTKRVVKYKVRFEKF